MNTELMFSSQSSDWETPHDLFKRLDNQYHFTLDVCASKRNRKCNHYYSPKVDALKQPWVGVCWMNPPYGRQIKHWIKKAYETSLDGATVVCLLPSRTDTAWFHDYCVKGKITFLRGRLKFVGAENAAPFPSMLVEFKRRKRLTKRSKSRR